MKAVYIPLIRHSSWRLPHQVNVLVTDTLRAVLCDFGLSADMRDLGETGLETAPILRGTQRYLSPELTGGGSQRHSLLTDIWAWGCVLIEVRYAKRAEGRTILILPP